MTSELTSHLIEPMDTLEMLTRREQLITEVESFIEEERYGDLCTDEFINWIADCICRNFPPPTPD